MQPAGRITGGVASVRGAENEGKGGCTSLARRHGRNRHNRSVTPLLEMQQKTSRVYIPSLVAEMLPLPHSEQVR